MRKKVTKEQVFTTADGLRAAGKKVSVRAIREQTGGRNGTILDHLREWREANGIPWKHPDKKETSRPKSKKKKVPASCGCESAAHQLTELKELIEMVRPMLAERDAELEYLRRQVPTLTKRCETLAHRNECLEQEIRDCWERILSLKQGLADDTLRRVLLPMRRRYKQSDRLPRQRGSRPRPV